MFSAFFRSLKQEFAGYNSKKLLADMMAGLTVCAVALPLALAFGVSSGASAASGLVTAIIAGVVIAILGGASYQISGPTGAMSAVLVGIVAEYGLQGVFFACLAAGVLLLAGVFKLGRLISFIPMPVIMGFTSGIAIIIAMGQIDNFFGTVSEGGSNLEKLASYGRLGFHPNMQAVLIGLLVVLVMVFWPKKWGARVPGSLVGIILATIVATVAGMDQLAVVGDIPKTLLLADRLSLGGLSFTMLENLLSPIVTIAALGCDENGIIQGVKASVVSDTGGFASLGGPVLERACTHAAGPYHYENFEIEGHAYYTNNPPAGAFRGFGVTQTCFATETLLNEMADLVGISPWEIRYRNAIRPGEVLPNGQIVGPETGLVETLEAIKPYYDEAVKNGEPVGLACAMKNAGVGVGLPDYGRCKLVIGDDGKVHIRAGASCIGQGLGTVLVQLVVTNAKLTRDQVVYDGNSTFITPDSGDTSGSRQTLVTGEACRRACLLLRDAMEYRSLSDLKGQEFYGEYYAKTNPLGADVPNPVSHVAYGYATQMCILDKETGKIKKMVAAHDVGKAINPLSCEGQIEGGVVMSMGYALTEQYPLDHGKPTAKYGTLGLFRSHQIPEIKAIVIDKPGLNLANGAIGIGEITSIPTAPAIAQAYYRYDGERRRSLPLDHTPYKK